MAKGLPILPTVCNTDLAADSLPPGVVRLIKNLTMKKSSNGSAYDGLGDNEDTQKPLQANAIYGALKNAPSGSNFPIGSKYFELVNRVYVCCHNSNGNHFVYRINCTDETLEIVKIDPTFNFQLKPEYFIHTNNMHLEVVSIVDPVTNETVIKEDLYFNDGYNYQRYIRVNDCIDTNGFDKAKFPYFKGDYDANVMISMGVPSLDNCISITEEKLTSTDAVLNNDLLFKGWKFRVKGTDVFGRPSEHGIIASYIPGINDCLSTSDNLSRCINLVIKVDNPLIDSVDIEYLNGTGTVWYKSATVRLYEGDRVKQWWLRKRNPDIIFNEPTFELTHKFCADGEHEALSPVETSRLFNPLPRDSQMLVKLTKRIGLVNNGSGFNPLTEALLKKLSVSIEKPTATTTTDLATITVYVPIWNEVSKVFGSVYKAQDSSEGFVFGTALIFPDRTIYYFPRPYQQYFTNIAQSGFIGYLNDGDSVVSTQVYVDASGNIIEDENHEGIFLSPRQFTMQKFVFTNKKRGNYVFRLASHLTDPVTTPDFQATSTTVWGLCPYTRSGDAFNINTNGRENSQELSINCCSGDYDTLTDNKILCICDFTNNNEQERVTSGYIYEILVDGVPALPMELIDVTSVNGFTSNITDHNGFYYFATQGSGRTFVFNFNYKCAYRQFGFGEGPEGMTNQNIQMDGIIPGNGSKALFPDYAIAPCNRILITGRAVLAGSDIGISNALITLTRGGFAITDSNGNFSIVAHDDNKRFNSGRDDKLVFSSSCLYHPEGENCIEVINVHINPCSTCVEREVKVSGWNLVYDNYRGLLSGGSYRLGCCPADWLGRRPFIQDLGTINIPTVAETGIIAPCKVKINIAADAVFPSVFKWLTFFITEELSNADYIEWIVDKVEFIDIRGQVNNTNPTQIRLWYSSLNEYNKQNNFSTTCAWQFLVNNTKNPVIGDKVQFIINGDGTIYTNSIIALVKYDSEGQYFLIDYKPSLSTLLPSAKIRLVHPKESYSEKEAFYEICSSRVNLNDGVPDRKDFYLDAADTYYLTRPIPVPTSLNNQTEEITNTTATQDGSITTTVATTKVQAVAYSNQLKTLGFYFEHHSPSNFWGLRFWNNGRRNIRNIDEAEQMDENQIALSGEILPTGLLSYLNYFDTKLMVNFDIDNSGGIIGALIMPARVLWITQHYNFLTGYNDNLLRQQSDGTISVSAANGFGQPTTLADYNYGCQLRDKNTIGVQEDRIVFVDSTRAELICLMPGSTQGTIYITKKTMDVLFTAKVKSMINTNRFFTHAINPLTDEYLLTDFNLDAYSYINEERYYNVEKNETYSFDINTGWFLGQFGFTPEGYAAASGDVLHKQLFSFKNGLPWRHYDINTNTVFNTFYGVKVDRVLVFVYNIDKLTVKQLKFIEVYCKFLYWAFLITTESNQRSRLTKSQWTRAAKFYRAAFLCDLDTPDANNILANKLFEGNLLYGRYATIHLIGDATNNDQYSELAGTIVFATPYEKSGA